MLKSKLLEIKEREQKEKIRPCTPEMVIGGQGRPPLRDINNCPLGRNLFMR